MHLSSVTDVRIVRLGHKVDGKKIMREPKGYATREELDRANRYRKMLQGHTFIWENRRGNYYGDGWTYWRPGNPPHSE